MAIVEVTVAPLGTESTSISSYVAGCQKILEKQDKVKYTLTPMGTILEGDLNDCMKLVRKMHETPFQVGAERVTTQIKIDDRRDVNGTMEQKLDSVKTKINKDS
ncbi:MTH1187 family thiamine-binding protein [Natranaerobius trueperi]|uniref:Thiamine-binding protein domain-containing protein n=1 Tax=Natranaerobius trueperi TaxID=759412 RepID=A0A226BZS9_9FIRM|nr:MTH1187 family thiamine-binding protein [Natranaerobius trueperi]OWZ84523.1 hypothetical protein CDO51_03215 [Natranaerobius trueperi]